MRDLTDAELAKLIDKDIFHKISDAADKLGWNVMLWAVMSATYSLNDPLTILTSWWWGAVSALPTN